MKTLRRGVAASRARALARARAGRPSARRHEDMPVFTRELEVRSDTYDPESRTFSMVLTTGEAVLRRTWSGEPFMESLSLNDGAVRTKRLDRGIAILDEHGFSGLKD